MKIAAFDLSLVATGWALSSTATGEIQMGTLHPPKDKLGMARLHWIRSQIGAMLETKKLADCVDFVLFEDLAFAAHDRNHERAGLACLVRHKLWLNRVPYLLISPMSLKKYVLGIGKGEKSQMLKAVYKKWGIDAADDNQADAVGLLQIGMHLISGFESQTKAEKEVLHKVCEMSANYEAVRAIAKLRKQEKAA